MDFADIDNYPATLTTYETKTFTILANKIRKDDTIDGALVSTVAVGNKWVQVREDDGKLILRCLKSDSIQVDRAVETQQSVKADLRSRTNRKLCRKLSGDLRESVSDAQALVNEHLDTYTHASYDRVGTLLVAQENYRVWMTFKTAVDCQSTLDESEYKDICAIYEAYVAELKASFFSGAGGIRALSKSSNQLSNLMDDIALAAKTKFIEDSRWMF